MYQKNLNATKIILKIFLIKKKNLRKKKKNQEGWKTQKRKAP